MFAKLSHRQQLFLILGLNLILSLPSLWVPFYNIDELTNAIHGKFLAEGDLGIKDFVGNTYLLTHYLYGWVYMVFKTNSLLPFHILHIIWKSFTILALYWAGTQLKDRQTGIWSALFYCVFSTCFMSKDFHTPSAESLSLLPGAISGGLVFMAINYKKPMAYFFAGIFAALAMFFKAPMGILIVALNLVILVSGPGFFKKFFYVNMGFLLTMFFPALLVSPFGEGFALMYNKVNGSTSKYIQFHEGFTFLYWFAKLMIRTGLVFLSCLALSAFAIYGTFKVFKFNKKNKENWQKLFFLFTWTILVWFAVPIGKRVFYHYFVFLLAPMALLAGAGIREFDLKSVKLALQSKKFLPLKFVRKYLAYFMILPAAIFFFEGAFNFSTKALGDDFAQVIQYIHKNTKDNDKIYVWGNVPQLYFYSDRLPSTVDFWSDLLAGISPGSPSMEYMNATKNQLKFRQMLVKDFNPQIFERRYPQVLGLQSKVSDIKDFELFTVPELLEQNDKPYWQKVFADFLEKPPVLFIDTSPANIRGFGHFPIKKFELLKRFVGENYKLETILDGIAIYRLKT